MNIAPLARCKNLTSLDLTDNNLKDITPLASNRSLRKLNLYAPKVKDTSALAHISGLKIRLPNKAVLTMPPKKGTVE